MYTGEQLRLPPRLELAEVIRQANRLLKLVPALADSGEFSERTIYYYVQKRLLPRRAGRGPGTTYAPGFVYRLLYIRLLQKAGLSLDDIRRDYLHGSADDVSDDKIKSVLLGESPLPMANDWDSGPEAYDDNWDRLPSRMPVGAAIRSDRMLRRQQMAKAAEKRRLAAMEPAQFAAQWGRLEDSESPAEFEMLQADDEKPVRRYPLGESAELLVHRELTPSQERRLDHLTRLLSDILDEPD